MASFLKLEACGQTVLPDSSVLIGQILVENTKIKTNFECDILSHFQTMCARVFKKDCILQMFVQQQGRNPTRFTGKLQNFVSLCERPPLFDVLLGEKEGTLQQGVYLAAVML